MRNTDIADILVKEVSKTRWLSRPHSVMCKWLVWMQAHKTTVVWIQRLGGGLGLIVAVMYEAGIKGASKW